MNEQLPRLLILADPSDDQTALTQALSGLYNVIYCHDYQEAMDQLKARDFQNILVDVGDFLPLERALIDQRSKMILNTIGEGVCVVNDVGECVWANDKLKLFPPEVYEKMRDACKQAYSAFTKQTSPTEDGQQPKARSKKYGFQIGNDQYFEAMVSPAYNHENKIKQVVAVVWDASSGRRLQQKIDAIDSAGQELVRLESAAVKKMHVSERLDLLERKIIKYSKDLLSFDHFCIRMVDHKVNKLELVMSQGLPQEALEVDIYAEPEGNGISGYVAATGRSYVCHDVERDPRYLAGLGHAKSSLTIPLRFHDKIIGVFNIESQTPGKFNEDDRQFSEIFGRYIALAMNMLDLLVVERYMTTERITENVMESVQNPLDRIEREAQSLQDEFVGHDSMRDRLDRILNDIDIIRNSVKEVADGRQAVLGIKNMTDEDNKLLKGQSVLVADDDVAIREKLYEVMLKLGADVQIAKDGREALTMIDANDFDLILSDIRMPHRSGYDLFAFSKRKNPMVPVILMTGFGYDPSHQIVRANKEGLQGVLPKPFEVSLLISVLKEALSPSKNTTDQPQIPRESE